MRVRVLLAVAAVLAFALPAGQASARHAKHTSASSAKGPTVADAWPELRGDLPPDADTLRGVLPNGMRYEIKHNITPPGLVSLRLRIGAGSLDETPGNAGIAHLIEHMTFRGTTHIADGDAIRKLESLGLALEADVNAFTSATQTFFTYDLPKNDPETVASGLMLLRETASEALFDPASLDSERQVVMAEKRMHDSASLHTRTADEVLLLGDRAGHAMLPIGSEDVIRNATPQQLRAFYNSYYRPDNATLIVVGDVDPKAMEAAIREHFESWRAKGTAPTRPTVAMPAPSATRAATIAERGAPAAVIYSWVKPEDAGLDSKARDRANLVELLGVTILNQRLEKLASARDVPIIQAFAGHVRTRGLPDIHQLTLAYGPKGAVAAMDAGYAALSDILRDGVTQAELDRALGDVRALFDAASASGTTTPSTALANLMLRLVDENQSFLMPAQSAALFHDEARDVTVEEVSHALREAFSGSGPFVLVSGFEEPKGGAEAVTAALTAELGKTSAEVASKSGQTAAAAALAPWPYTSFGTSGTVISREEAPDLGVTLVTFANGVHATIKPTSFRTGQVLVGATFGHGRLGLPKDRTVPAWALPAAFQLGGLRLESFDDMNTRFEGQFVGMRLVIRDDFFEIIGGTRPADFNTEMQIISAYVDQPGWRSDAIAKARMMELMNFGHAQRSPDGVLQRNQDALLHGQDPRWSIPGIQDIDDAGPRETRNLITDALKGPLEVTVVGDVTVDQAIATLAATVGALPPRRSDEKTVVGDEHFAHARTEPLVLHHDGEVTQAAAEIDWQTLGFFPDLQGSRNVRVLQEVLLHRLFDELRTRDGLTYVPQAEVSASTATPDFGYLSAAADIPPDKVDAFYSAVSRVVDDLKAKPISDDELSRARDPRVNDLLRDRQTNEYWLAALSGVSSDPRLLDAMRTTIAGLKAVTSAGVQQAAQSYLRDDRAFKVVVLPKDYQLK